MINPIPYKSNIKKHPLDQLYKLALSIKEFGWRQSIVVDKDNVIIVGHGRWEAYSKYKDEMSLPEPRIEVASDMSEEQVKAYRLADNLLASSDYDMDLVFGEMDGLQLGFQELLKFESKGQTEKADKQEEEYITDDKFQAYLNNTIRQVVLHYAQEDFLKIQPQLEALKKKFGFETNSEVVAKLVDEEMNR